MSIKGAECIVKLAQNRNICLHVYSQEFYKTFKKEIIAILHNPQTLKKIKMKENLNIWHRYSVYGLKN